ncbi:MAG: peptide chain release factor N(5)-glutamine methyltransferase [Planctomycetes bacterium]|nr:peptide chain release factor N(5)-glutamine methyltransferase [Planctomycetota bacterium]
MSQRKHAGEEMNWTTRRLLDWTTAYLQKKQVDSPRLCAEMLMAHVLEIPRIHLYMDLDRPASPLERAAFRELVEKAAAQHPVQYLMGYAYFFSMIFEVNEHVLIPRPCTEMLVEHVIQHARHVPGFASPQIADLGTGSGCIAVALAKHLPAARIVAVDTSAAALEVAKRNAAKHGVSDRIDFVEGDLFEALGGRRFSYIVSNPPYISDAEWAEVEANVKDYEPTGALRAGADGLEVLRRLIAAAGGYLAEPGQLVVEIAASQKAAVIALVKGEKGLREPRVMADHEGFDRMLLADGDQS